SLCERSRSRSSSQLMILRNVCNYDIQSTTTKNILLSQPNWREQALSRVDSLIRSGSVDVIVPDRALEYKMGDAHMIIQAATCLELQSMVVLKRKGSPR
ncbi:unnamed protein product, partial [Brassica rapa]